MPPSGQSRPVAHPVARGPVAGAAARRLLAAAALLAVTAGDVPAQSAVAVGQYGDWALMSDGQEPKSVCFVVTAARDSEPKGLNRENALFYVSAWPKDGIKAEVSIRLGFKAKKGAEATLTVGGTAFKLSPRDDRVFVEDVTRELKVVEAMRKAPTAMLSATSERGTGISDTFSLAGLSQALQALAAACP